jgi:hypothetical protein
MKKVMHPETTTIKTSIANIVQFGKYFNLLIFKNNELLLSLE